MTTRKDATGATKSGIRCEWDGDCDNCPEYDCIATPSQASKFYNREERETKRRYGRETVRAYLKQMQKSNLFDKFGRRKKEWT